jgi:D-glycero-D-manno-heptose 1,7-bisphosphate phosphatase
MNDSSLPQIQGIEYVFLDRDGVINRKPPEDQTISRWKDFDILPGVEEAIARLNASGRKVIVVTNQRAIALGQYTKEDLDRLHTRL